MIDHIGVGVSDFVASKAFYTKALQAIGYELLYEPPAEVTGHGGQLGGAGASGDWDGDD